MSSGCPASVNLVHGAPVCIPPDAASLNVLPALFILPCNNPLCRNDQLCTVTELRYKVGWVCSILA